MSAPAKYGNRNVPKMIRQIQDLRQIIAAEGTPAVQDAWGTVEEHIDFAYRGIPAPSLPEAAQIVLAAIESEYGGVDPMNISGTWALSRVRDFAALAQIKAVG